MHSSFRNKARNLAASLGACAFGLIAAGCHHNNVTSGFGVAWTTLTTTDDAGQFSNYIVSVDSVVLVGKTTGAISAIAVPETMDLTKLTNLSELSATASVPVDTFTGAIITLDYTNAQISVMVNGVPTKAKIVDPSGLTPATVAVQVNFDPSNQLVFTPTFATSNALRLALNFDLSASSSVDLTTSPPTVTVKPFMSLATTAVDNKLIRVRGPLINSSVNLETYTIIVRPFFDEVNTFGILTLFNNANTVYTLGGNALVGAAGIQALSQSSAGSTMTAAYTTFQPTPTPQAGVIAGIFHTVYVIAGGTLEDFFTDGMEGDVIARSNNVLTLRGATLFANLAQIVAYQDIDSLVTIGPNTQVTADGVTGALNFNSISVGQHIIARGLLSQSAAGVTMLDSTGSTTDTGSVRLISTQAFGSLLSATTGSLLMNVQAISGWPVGVFNFAGNGLSAAQDSNPASYVVNTGALALPVAGAGDPLLIDGYTSPFGSAPPDFLATAVNSEATAPATLEVTWTGTGTAAPFSTLTSSGLTIDLANAAFGSGQLRIGGVGVNVTTLSASPTIVPAVAVPAANGLALFTPRFSVGPGAIAESTVGPILSFNGFGAFVTQLTTTFATPTPATRFVAQGQYNRAANTFTASSIDVVL